MLKFVLFSFHDLIEELCFEDEINHPDYTDSGMDSNQQKYKITGGGNCIHMFS